MPAGPRHEGDMSRRQGDAAFNAGKGPGFVYSEPPKLVVATPRDLALLRDNAPGTYTRFGPYEADGHITPGGLLNPLLTLPPYMTAQAVLLERSAPMRTPPEKDPAKDTLPSTLRLPSERARLLPEITERRAGYFRTEDGQRQIDMDHEDIRALQSYGNEILDSKRRGEDGKPYGLRVRASERNAGNQEMLALGDMSLRDLVTYTKEHRPFHFRQGTKDLLLPHDYAKATADTKQWGEAQFYHDAPVLVDGILASDIPDKVEYAKGMVENLIFELYLLDGHIGNGTTLSLMKNSQTPSLSRMVLNVHSAMTEAGYDQHAADEWLGAGMEAAAFEFTKYWKSPSPNNNHLVRDNHIVTDTKLITPGDADVGTLAEYETGMDTTAEYHGRAHDYQVTHINSALVRYALDLATYQRKIGNHDEAERWQRTGDEMKAELHSLYDGRTYRDRDARRTGTLNSVMSLNAFKVLADGVALPEHAATMAEELDSFRGPYGLAHLVPETVAQLPSDDVLSAFHPDLRATVVELRGRRQWGDGKEINTEWAIDVDAVIDGLARYDHTALAIEVAEDYLLGAAEDLKHNGTLYEKRNVLTGQNGEGVEYPAQKDFGWSAALPLKIMRRLPHLYALQAEAREETAGGISSSDAHPQVDGASLLRQDTVVEFV